MRMLAPHGEVIGVDSGPASAPEGFEVHARTDGIELLDRVRTVVKSPGVPQEAPVVQAARARGIEVTGELELAWRLMPDTRFVAVTGTNGKTTTAELLGAIHGGAAVAGNVGTALSSLVEDAPPLVICEASSFQLEDTSQFAPEVAVLINLGEDHLDRHGTVEAYQAAKMRVFANQTGDDIAVVPLGMDAPRARVTFGGPGADLAHVEDRLEWRGEPLIDVAEIRLRGAHNLENAMAAAAAALAGGVDPDEVLRGLRTFAGVAAPARGGGRARRRPLRERLQGHQRRRRARRDRGVRAGHRARDPRRQPQGRRLRGPAPGGRRSARAAYLIGEAAERLAADLEGTVPLHRSGDLATAVAAARAAARAPAR